MVSIGAETNEREPNRSSFRSDLPTGAILNSAEGHSIPQTSSTIGAVHAAPCRLRQLGPLINICETRDRGMLFRPNGPEHEAHLLSARVAIRFRFPIATATTAEPPKSDATRHHGA